MSYCPLQTIVVLRVQIHTNIISMRYAIKNQQVTLYLDNPKRTTETIARQSFAGSGLSEQTIISVLNAVVIKYRGQVLRSQQSITTIFLRPFFAFFKKSGNSWPLTSADWQITIYSFFEFYLTDTTWSKGQSRYRIGMWSGRVASLLEFFVEEEIIPRDVKIPKIRRKWIRSLSKEQALLGQPHTDLTTKPKKLLLDINIGITDADYLDTIEKKCRNLVNVIRTICQTHWTRLMLDGETGRKLADQVTDSEIESAITTQQYGTPRQNGGPQIRYASPAYEHGLAWALALIRHSLANGNTKDCVSLETLRASPFFPKRLFFTRKKHEHYGVLENLTAMSHEQWQAIQLPAQFYRFSGLLTNVDIAAVCCLLIIEHPSFTSEALQDARLLDVRGKPYLLLTDNNEHSILSLDKPRAGNRKSVVLTSVSQKLVMDILQWTAPVRKALRRCGDKTWRYLFLGVTHINGQHGHLGILEGKVNYLTGRNTNIGLTTIYPEFNQHGLEKGSFDFRRLRNTLGVIRWFETGSIIEMSRQLGNTRKVALENYLPPALLHAWNTRIIRRFQNFLIILAAHDEPYLLEVTDFSNIQDLQHFVAQLVSDYPPKTSPLGNEVQRRLGSDQQKEAVSSTSTPSLLSVQLSPKSLGILYAFCDYAKQTLSDDELKKIDALTGLAPQQFIDIGSLFRHAAESESIHSSLREMLDVPLLKQVHGEALAMQKYLTINFPKLAIKDDWMERL